MPYVANHSAYNFHNPDEFVPERFLPDSPAEYRDDKRAALKPFGHGPRVCIGEKYVSTLPFQALLFQLGFKSSDEVSIC